MTEDQTRFFQAPYMNNGDHFNNLNPVEHEILSKLLEESAEIIQAVGKTMLHGLDSSEPAVVEGPTNRNKIENELGDLLFFMGVAIENGLLDHERISQAFSKRASRPNHYLHHVSVEQ